MSQLLHFILLWRREEPTSYFVLRSGLAFMAFLSGLSKRTEVTQPKGYWLF